MSARSVVPPIAPRAVVIGPGKIGCGFAGQILHEAGYALTLVGRDRVLLDHLRRAGRYRVRAVGGGAARTGDVPVARTLLTSDVAAVADAIGECDVVVVAVGAAGLATVAPLIAAGLRRRTRPLNILAFENLADAGGILRRHVAAQLPPGFPLVRHGFSGAVIHRAVTQRLGDPAGDEPLTFLGDAEDGFVVERETLRQPLPALPTMRAVADFAAWIRRKLYTFSLGHATCAYLGCLKGYEYIHSAIRDPEIRAHVLAAMREGQRGLLACYGAEVAGDERDLERIVARFENAALNDRTVRVARDPRRKLAADDRLLGAAHLARAAGIEPRELELAAAAALLFCEPADPSATALQREIDQVGFGPALEAVSGLDAGQGLGRAVVDACNRLAAGWRRGSLLLRLDQPLWAWS